MKIFALASLMLVANFWVNAQQSMQEQFDEFYQKQTFAWEDYRMIKVPKLQDFWAVVSDTLIAQDSILNAFRAEAQSASLELNTLKLKYDSTQTALSSRLESDDTIPLFGAQVSKGVYNIVVCLVIIALIGGMVACFLMYRGNISSTTKAKLDLEKLEAEFLEHKNDARDRQAKIKRELQTALNTIAEHRLN